jgi:hypothetical protein
LKRVLQNLAGRQRARKQEAQSKLAVARATGALDQLEREQWKKACNRFDRPTVVQEITVQIKDGETVTQMSPENGALLYEIGRAIHPPEQVCRSFYFPDGIPSDYSDFTGRPDCRRKSDYIVHQLLPVSAWRDTAAEPFRFVK